MEHTLPSVEADVDVASSFFFPVNALLVPEETIGDSRDLLRVLLGSGYLLGRQPAKWGCHGGNVVEGGSEGRREEKSRPARKGEGYLDMSKEK